MEMEQAWFKEYSNAAYVDLSLGENDHYKKYARQCAEWLGWNYDDLQGDPQLVKRFVDGEWNPEDFLIVEPDRR